MFAEIRKYGTVCYVFPRKMPPKNWGHLWGQRPRKEHIPPPICRPLGACGYWILSLQAADLIPYLSFLDAVCPSPTRENPAAQFPECGQEGVGGADTLAGWMKPF